VAGRATDTLGVAVGVYMRDLLYTEIINVKEVSHALARKLWIQNGGHVSAAFRPTFIYKRMDSR
jgi:hypothetical protein